MPRYPRSPFKKVGASISPKVAGDALDEIIIGSTTPSAGDFTTGNFTDILTQNGANLAGSVYQSQSFTNLLKNGDFESWSAGVNAAPDGWISENSPTILKETSIKKIGTASVKLTASASDSNLYVVVSDHTRYRTREVTVGCWVYSTHSDARIDVYDGVGAQSTYHSGITGWEWLTATRIVNSSSTMLRIYLFPDWDGGTKAAYYDGVMLVEGSVCPAFSPKPAPSMSLITSAPTDTGYDGEIRIYSTGGTRRLYISDGTDWKYVSVAT